MSNIVVSDFIGQAKRVVEMPDRQGPPDVEGNPNVIKGNKYPALWIEDAYSTEEFMADAAAESAIRAEKKPSAKLHDLWRSRIRRLVPTISVEDLGRLTIRQLPRLHDELMAFEATQEGGAEADPLAPAETPPTSTPEPSLPT